MLSKRAVQQLYPKIRRRMPGDRNVEAAMEERMARLQADNLQIILPQEIRGYFDNASVNRLFRLAIYDATWNLRRLRKGLE